MELNQPLRFYSVNETNFPSILRRAFVWKPKARFLDPIYLQDHYPGHEADGVFPKNAKLREFLVSGLLSFTLFQGRSCILGKGTYLFEFFCFISGMLSVECPLRHNPFLFSGSRRLTLFTMVVVV